MMAMDWSEARKNLLLLAVAGAFFFATRYDLLSPGGLKAVQEKLLALWSAYGVFALVGLAALLTVFAGWKFYQWRAQAAYARAILEAVASGPTLQLLPRADAKPVQPERVQVWKRLADALPHDEHISFELAGNQDGLGFYLHGSDEGMTAALTQFRAEWPGLFRKRVDSDPAQAGEGWQVWWVELAPGSYELPVLAASDDPLRAILIEVNGVMGQGRGLVQVIARRNFGAREQLGRKAFAARDEDTPSKGIKAIRAQEAKIYEERAQAIYLDVTVRAVGLADTRERAQGIARGLSRAIAASFGGRNPLQPVEQGRDPARVLRREPARKMTPWSADDLAYLAHLAGSDLFQLAPRLSTAPARYLSADPEMRFDTFRHRTAFLE